MDSTRTSGRLPAKLAEINPGCWARSLRLSKAPDGRQPEYLRQADGQLLIRVFSSAEVTWALSRCRTSPNDEYPLHESSK